VASPLPMPPMGGGAPPTQGPPPAMGMPTLANVPPSAPPPADPMAAGGALPRLVFEIESSISTLAKALPPEMSQKLDIIKEQLREVVAEALSGSMGSPEQGTPAGPY